MRGKAKLKVLGVRAGVWIGLFLLTACAISSIASGANPTKVGYDVTVIGDFSAPVPPEGAPVPSQGSASLGMNNAGDVTGWSYYSATDSSVYAFLYLKSSGALIRLRALPPDGWDSYGYAVNDSGVVVGGATSSGPIGFYPFSWQGGVMTNLLAAAPDCINNLSGCGGFAYDINSRNDIVGERFTPESRGAFLYSHGTFKNLGDSESTATAINDRGDVVGRSAGRAFVYRGGMISDLGTLGGVGSLANDVSENGKVVGVAALATEERHAFLWAHGAMRDLGTLGGSFSEATAINRRGTTIVGTATTSDGDVHGFVYAGGKMVDLNELIDPGIGTIVDAQDVNHSGQIAVQISVSRTLNGVARDVRVAALLTPRR